jgi:superfamily II DNA or RNA helicase
VLVRGARWRALEHTPFLDCEALRLARPGSDARGGERTLLIPFDRPRRIERSPSMAVVRPRRWLHSVRRAEADAVPAGGLAAAAACKVDLLPYQIEPALAMIRMGVARVMIADAVGLGKTIQAALVLAELARRDAFRGLVIVPSGLRDQWCAELARRFSLETKNADAEWLARTGRQLPSDVNPWILPGLYVSSFDFIKRPEVLQPLEGVNWDIVVVDEAHGASLGTARRAAVHAVAARATRVLLLTATPHAGDAEQFEALCRIGDPGGKGPPLLLFQRTRADVGVSAIRRTIILPVRLTDPERRMHRLLDDYTSRVCREAEARGDPRARLAAIVLKKRALSSAASLAASARRRLLLIADGISAPVEYQPGLPLEPEEGEGEALPDRAPDEELEAPGLADAAHERRWLSVIAECAENASRHESKTRLLLRLLRRMRQPAIVFTEFRDTLERLHRAARSAGHDVHLLHGGLSPGERLAARRAFGLRGGVLLATDAASEGLNLHEGCRAVIHYELPWSPGRLEQRTGRVDRIGQSRPVHEVLLVAGDTAERLVLAPLARRAARARPASSSSARLVTVLSESRVAAAVMAGTRVDDQESVVDSWILPAELVQAAPPALREQGAAEAARLRHQRTVTSAHAPTRRSPALVATVVRRRSSDLPSAIFCIYTISLTTEDGHVLDRQIACVSKPWPIRTWPRASAEVRRLTTDFLRQHGPALRNAALMAHAGTRATVTTTHAGALNAMERRERTIASAVPSTARVLVQAGLFDRRALKALRAKQRVSGALLEASDERLRSLDRTRALAVAAELTAVLIACGGSG